MKSEDRRLFDGCATALVTPMRGGEVDLDAYRALVRDQIAGGVDAIVVTGTTGESPTLTDREKERLWREAVRICHACPDRRIPVIAGSGSNNTVRAAHLSQIAEEAGVDGLLLVTPYYNKTSQTGLVKHYEAILDAVPLPAIIYHVPSRTGCALEVDTCRTLAEHPLVVGLKEASGHVGFAARIAAACGDSLPLYSGNDDMILPYLSLGGRGVISVVSNLLPRETSTLCRAWREGLYDDARRIQHALLPLCDALFCEVNPIPVKCAMALCGMCEEDVRLPLAPASEGLRDRLRRLLPRYGLLS